MMDHLIGETPDLWNVILDGPTIAMKNGTEPNSRVPKERIECDTTNNSIQNNAKAKKNLICGIGPASIIDSLPVMTPRQSGIPCRLHTKEPLNQEG